MTICNHIKTVCPKHHGAFDCTPFCDICEGETEYCSICNEWEAEQARIYLAQYKEENE